MSVEEPIEAVGRRPTRKTDDPRRDVPLLMVAKVKTERRSGEEPFDAKTRKAAPRGRRGCKGVNATNMGGSAHEEQARHLDSTQGTLAARCTCGRTKMQKRRLVGNCEERADRVGHRISASRGRNTHSDISNRALETPITCRSKRGGTRCTRKRRRGDVLHWRTCV